MFHELCEKLGIDKKRTTAYRASSNGQAERVNKVLGQALRSIILSTARADQTHWDEKLQLIAGAIRCTVNRNTGYTPNMMMFGREVTQPLELMTGITVGEQSASEFVSDIQTQLAEAHTRARSTLKEAQRRQKHEYDIRQHVTRYRAGDAALLTNSATKIGQSKKLQPLWLGPFIVTKVISPILYKISSQRRTFVVHHDRIRHCFDKVLPGWLLRRRFNLSEAPNILDETLGPLADAPIHCYCRKPDDGSLMVICENCFEWFHVETCLGLTKEELDEIPLFFCSCRDCE